MLEAVTITIARGAMGLLFGALIPACVAYSILFVRRYGRKLGVFLRLGGRLLVVFVLIGVLSTVITEVVETFGAEVVDSQPFGPYFIGIQVGFWGSVAALIIGIRRGRRDRGAMQRGVPQS